MTGPQPVTEDEQGAVDILGATVLPGMTQVAQVMLGEACRRAGVVLDPDEQLFVLWLARTAPDGAVTLARLIGQIAEARDAA
jgi:hypothetical protein